MSTYGSLSITGLNVLLFIVTILLVEPWKRKRLVEGVETRLRENTRESHEATQASLLALQSLLTATNEAWASESIQSAVQDVEVEIAATSVNTDASTPPEEAETAVWRDWLKRLPDRHSHEGLALASTAGVVVGVLLSIVLRGSGT